MKFTRKNALNFMMFIVNVRFLTNRPGEDFLTREQLEQQYALVGKAARRFITDDLGMNLKKLDGIIEQISWKDSHLEEFEEFKKNYPNLVRRVRRNLKKKGSLKKK